MASSLPLLFVAANLMCWSAYAQEIDPGVRRAALEMAASGDSLFAQGDYAAALAQFTRAAELVTAPTLMLRQAECLEKLGRLVDAAEAYRHAADFAISETTTEPFRLAVANAKQRLTAVEARTAHLGLVIQAEHPESVLVTLNENPVSVPQRQNTIVLDPGHYRIRAIQGTESASSEVTLEEGSRVQVVLRLPIAPPAVGTAETARPNPKAPPPAAAPPPATIRQHSSVHRTAGWVSLSVGGVGVLTGLIAGFEVYHLKRELDHNGCIDSVCGPDQRQDVQTYNAMRVLSATGAIVGGLGLAVGGALLYFAPHAEPAASARITPWLGPSSAGIAGAF